MMEEIKITEETAIPAETEKNDSEVVALLRTVTEEQKRTKRWQRITAILLIVVMLCVAATCLSVVYLASQASDILVQAQETVDAIAEIDFAGLETEVTNSAEAAQEGLQVAMEAIEEIDIESLNQTIEDFGKVVEPLAKFFSRFK